MEETPMSTTIRPDGRKVSSSFFQEGVIKQASTARRVFEEASIDLPSGLNVRIVASDGILGKNEKGIQSYISLHHEWPYPSVVGFEVDVPGCKYKRHFAIDIPAFVNLFADPDKLVSYIESASKELADNWNFVNSDARRVNVRVHNEKFLRIDHRKPSWVSKDCFLELNGTSWGFTWDNINVNRTVVCTPSDIKWQIRLNPCRETKVGRDGSKTRNTGLKSGLNFTKRDMIYFIKHEDLDGIYNHLSDSYPLTEDYVSRLVGVFQRQTSSPPVPDEDDVDEADDLPPGKRGGGGKKKKAAAAAPKKKAVAAAATDTDKLADERKPVAPEKTDTDKKAEEEDEGIFSDWDDEEVTGTSRTLSTFLPAGFTIL